VVDNHIRHHANNQQNQQDHRLVAKPIIHHHRAEYQDRTLQGPIDQYVQSQGHH